MRPRRRTGPLAHVLIAGDVCEVDAVRALLCALPADSYGQVILEADAESAVPQLHRPARVGLTALVRSDADRPGARLSRAVEAWVEEWVVDEPDPARDVAVWVGASVRWTAAPMQGQLERL